MTWTVKCSETLFKPQAEYDLLQKTVRHNVSKESFPHTSVEMIQGMENNKSGYCHRSTCTPREKGKRIETLGNKMMLGGAKFHQVESCKINVLQNFTKKPAFMSQKKRYGWVICIWNTCNENWVIQSVFHRAGLWIGGWKHPNSGFNRLKCKRLPNIEVVNNSRTFQVFKKAPVSETHKSRLFGKYRLLIIF